MGRHLCTEFFFEFTFCKAWYTSLNWSRTSEPFLLHRKADDLRFLTPSFLETSFKPVFLILRFFVLGLHIFTLDAQSFHTHRDFIENIYKDFNNRNCQWVGVVNATHCFNALERTTVLGITGYLWMRICAQSTASRWSLDGSPLVESSRFHRKISRKWQFFSKKNYTNF